MRRADDAQQYRLHVHGVLTMPSSIDEFQQTNWLAKEH